MCSHPRVLKQHHHLEDVILLLQTHIPVCQRGSSEYATSASSTVNFGNDPMPRAKHLASALLPVGLCTNCSTVFRGVAANDILFHVLLRVMSA